MTNGDVIPIRYRDFWDQPRIFFATYRGQLYLFDCPFDEEVEDYPEIYHIYAMPDLTEEEFAGSWVGVSSKALRHLGDVSLSAVRFDPTRRRSIDPAILDELTTPRPVAG